MTEMERDFAKVNPTAYFSAKVGSADYLGGRVLQSAHDMGRNIDRFPAMFKAKAYNTGLQLRHMFDRSVSSAKKYWNGRSIRTMKGKR